MSPPWRAKASAAPARGCCAASARASPRSKPLRPLQGRRARALFLERLPGQPRGADDVCRSRRHDCLGRAESREPDRRHPPVAGAPRDLAHNDVGGGRRGARGRARGRRSSSSNRSSAWMATRRRSASYAALCEDAGAHLIVDEAHAVGVYGERGRGLIEEHGLDRPVFLSINTAGKALGVAAPSSPGRRGRSTT